MRNHNKWISTKFFVFLGIILVFILLLVPFASAKGPVVVERWNQTYGGPEDDIGQYFYQITDQGFLILAYTNSYGSGGTDAWIIRTDASGNELSNRTYGGLKNDSFRVAKQMGNGDWLLSGLTDSYGAGKLDAWLMRTDEPGNEKWNKTYGGTGNDQARGLTIPDNNSILLTGWTNSFGAGQMDAWLIRTYANGTLNWSKTIGGPLDEKLRSISKTTDGGYILCGETNSRGFGDSDGWLVKTDGNGNELWNRTFGGPGYDMFYTMNRTNDDGYAITGSTNSFGNGGNDTWLFRVDSNGNELWNRTFGGPFDDIGHRVKQGEDGGYIIAGWTDSSGTGNFDFWLLKTDTNGSMIWNAKSGGISDDKSRDIIETSDGNYAIIGYTTSHGAGKKDVWFIKLDVFYPPVVDFTGIPSSGNAPLVVQFYDNSTESPTGWSWNFGDEDMTNTTVQNPVHTYLKAGNYTVSLNVTSAGGFGNLTRQGYINVTNAMSKIGVFRNSNHLFYLDYNGNGVWNGGVTDRQYNFGLTEDNPASGDWNADGRTEIGVFRNSTHMFYLDYNGNGVWNGGVTDRQYNFGLSGDIPRPGDWNADGRTDIGVYRPSTHVFYLDYNGNGAWNGASIDRQYNFGLTGDIPITGDWNADGRTDIGVYRPSTHVFYLDYNGNGAWNGASIDRQYNFGLSGDIPRPGDWNADGRTEIGVFRNSTHLFYLDFNGNGAWNGASIDRQYNFGLTGDKPLSGKW
jgi:PKD repeat protein/predicted secreted protein